MNIEEWRSLPAEFCISNYKLSSLGRLRSEKTGYISQQSPQKNGYIVVQVVNDFGLMEQHRLHRLVAQAFLPIEEGKDVVDHINGICHDNRVENLRWVTTSQNNRNRKKYKKTGKPVYQISLDGLTILKKWLRISDAANELNLNERFISLVCKGTRPYIGGFKWKFCNESFADEIWKELNLDSEHESVFVSSHGRLKRDSEPDKIHIGTELPSGYMCIHVKIAEKWVGYLMHILIAKAFYGNPMGENMVVNHKDGNKKNNCADNLEWITRSENTIHAYKTGLVKKKVGGRLRPVNQLDLYGNIINKYEGLVLALEKTGITGISKACKEGTIRGGYLWKYNNT